jgi:hypothetical protein
MRLTVLSIGALAEFAIMILTPPSITYAFEQGVNQDFTGNSGVYAAIGGADPQIRDGAGGANFSYMRTGGRAYWQSTFTFVEIGWIKTGDVPYMRAYYSALDKNGGMSVGVVGTQTCCLGYNYEVGYDMYASDDGLYPIFFNSVGVYEVWTGLGGFSDFFAGGETSSSQNAMGVSYINNVQYSVNWPTNWFASTQWNPWTTNALYHVASNGTSNWIVWGNN